MLGIRFFLGEKGPTAFIHEVVGLCIILQFSGERQRVPTRRTHFLSHRNVVEENDERIGRELELMIRSKWVRA